MRSKELSGKYSFLIRFVQTECSESYLLHHGISREQIAENIRDGYIIKTRVQDDGDIVYAITSKGKKQRDK